MKSEKHVFGGAARGWDAEGWREGSPDVLTGVLNAIKPVEQQR